MFVTVPSSARSDPWLLSLAQSGTALSLSQAETLPVVPFFGSSFVFIPGSTVTSTLPSGLLSATPVVSGFLGGSPAPGVVVVVSLPSTVPFWSSRSPFGAVTVVSVVFSSPFTVLVVPSSLVVPSHSFSVVVVVVVWPGRGCRIWSRYSCPRSRLGLPQCLSTRRSWERGSRPRPGLPCLPGRRRGRWR